jgi:hypothetical protein
MIGESSLFYYTFWHFIAFPKKILKATFNFLRFGIRYFSIPFLLKTLFSHWHRYYWSYPKGFDLPLYLEAAFSNLISRIIGFFLRSILIFAGIFFEIFVLVSGIIILIIWYLLPVIVVFLFFYGVGSLFTI